MTVKAVSTKHNIDKMLHSWMKFQKLFDQNPQSDFFWVWTSFTCVDKDLWQLQLFLPNTTVTKCYNCEWIFKSCLIKVHKVTSLEHEPGLHVLIKIFDSYSYFYQTQHWQNVIHVIEISKVVWSKSTKWILLSMNQFYMCW